MKKIILIVLAVVITSVGIVLGMSTEPLVEKIELVKKQTTSNKSDLASWD